jgi:NADH:ubiquinone oxidoreductase subunit E
VSKLPTRSPTHDEIELSRLASISLEVEDVADGEQVTIPALVALAEDRGRPPSHYLAAVPLGTELTVAGDAPLTVKVCAGNCQRYGALDLLDHLIVRWQQTDGVRFNIAPVTCLDRCDHAPTAELAGGHGQLVLAPATSASIDEALDNL